MPRLFKAATRLLLAWLLAAGNVAALAQSEAARDVYPALLEAVVNGQAGAEPILFLRDADGRLYASAATFSAWRMRLPSSVGISHDGETYHLLDGADLRVELNEAEQAVRVEAATALFELQQASLVSAVDLPMSAPSAGAFFNYDMFLEHVEGQTNVTGAFQAGWFTRRGVGETSFVAAVGDGENRLVRLETAWTVDRPDRATSIRIGDSVTFSGPGAVPVRFAGVQYHRNYAVQPGFLTMPLPTGAGTAAAPSVVDIYVNNALQSSQQVGAGPFELSNIPVQSGGGTVQIVVRDLLGREFVSEQAYYASAQMLRRGLHDFSYEAGFVREGFGRRSADYGEFFASTSHRYGLSDRITVEGHAEASESIQMAGAAFSLLAFDLGQVGASASVSHSDQGVGYRLAGSFERQTRRWAMGVRAEYSSAEYEAIGLGDHHLPPRLTVQAFTDVNFGVGSIGFNVTHRSLRDRESETVAGATASLRAGPWGSVQLFARRVVAGRAETVMGAHFAVALGGRRSISATLEHDRHGANGYMSYQNDAPAGEGGGYRVAASFGAVDSVEASYVHNFRQASVVAHASHSNGRNGVRLSAAGSLGLLGGHGFAARSLGESFARVEVEGHEGVRVYADNQLIGTTDRNGAVLVPMMRAYDVNLIRIEEADLPLDVRIDTVERQIRPFARAGTRIRFDAKRERGVLLSLRLADGSVLPAGAALKVVGRDDMYVIASDGEAYLPDLVGTVTLQAMWDGKICHVVAEVPDNDDPQPHLGPLVCQENLTYAER